MKPPHILFEAIVGSQAYGLATPDSDIDKLGVFLKPTKMLVGIKYHGYGETCVGKDEQGDYCYHELGKAVELWLKCNPTVTELLWLPPVDSEATRYFMGPNGIYGPGPWVMQQLCELRTKFLTRAAVFNAYGGYARQQVEKLERRQDSFSSDTKHRTAKHARHCLRLLIQGSQLLQDGRLDVDCSKHRDWLFEMGELAERDVEAFVIEWRILDAEFCRVSEHSSLPEHADADAVNDFLVDVRKASWEL